MNWKRHKINEVNHMDDSIVLAKYITDCSECPLYENDCPGGWVGGPGGVPIEPPCCS